MSSIVEVQQPFEMKWTIKEENLKLLETSTSVFSSLSSKRKRLSPQIQYYLTFFPHGKEPTATGAAREALIMLNLEIGKSFKLSANFSFQLEGIPGNSKELNYFFDKTGAHGLSLCPSEDLLNPEKQYFVNGEMTVKVKGILRFNESQNSDEIRVETMAKTLGKMLWDMNDKDFVLAVGKNEIRIHKSILGVHTSLFTDSRDSRIQIPNYSIEIVEIIVMLCYDIHVSDQNIFKHKTELLKFVNEYQMPNVKEIIEKFLIKKLSLTNVCSMTNCAIDGKAEELQKGCYNLLMKCIKEETMVADLKSLNLDFKLKLFEDAFVFVG